MRFELLIATGILTAASLAADKPENITPKKVRESYKAFTQITKEPKSVAAELVSVCLPVNGWEEMKKETGPHAMHYLHYYVNETGQRHRDTRLGGAYPAGSVIVKEKLFRESERAEAKLAVTGVAGMIKRHPGSSPETGDWEFFYFGTDSLSEDGKASAKHLKSCVSCHSNATDMVFGRFDRPYVMPKSPGVENGLKLQITPSEGPTLDFKK